jgi:hypothetical protein
VHPAIDETRYLRAFLFRVERRMITYPRHRPHRVRDRPFEVSAPMDRAVHWYGLMYVVGFIAGWWLARRRAAMPGSTWKAVDVDDLIFFAAVGVILEAGSAGSSCTGSTRCGGPAQHHPRVAGRHVLPRRPRRRHGRRGALRAAARRNIADVFDFTAPLPAIGLCAGRIGNFINGELWGKPTDLPWGMLVKGEVLHLPAVRGGARRGRDVRDPLVVHVDPAAAARTRGSFPGAVRDSSASSSNSSACPTRTSATWPSAG